MVIIEKQTDSSNIDLHTCNLEMHGTLVHWQYGYLEGWVVEQIRVRVTSLDQEAG